MKAILKEFKEFIARGNVIDMAIGVVMGSAFTAIVNSLVNDLFMPLIGLIFGGIDFTSLRWVITPATETEAEAALCYGNFIQAVVNFLLIAVVVFMIVKLINKLNRKKEEKPAAPPEPPKPSEEVLLLREIRDQLKKK